MTLRHFIHGRIVRVCFCATNGLPSPSNRRHNDRGSPANPRSALIAAILKHLLDRNQLAALHALILHNHHTVAIVKTNNDAGEALGGDSLAFKQSFKRRRSSPRFAISGIKGQGRVG